MRQELDSLVRTIFILKQDNEEYRNQLLEWSVYGQRWQNRTNKGKITDREMVGIADTLHNWTQSVYKFGCAFIHLSSLHDHVARDPLRSLPRAQRDDLIEYLQKYHDGPCTSAPMFKDITPYFPKVLDKISSNLACYLSDLEKGKILD